jgi:hypothetical protein
MFYLSKSWMCSHSKTNLGVLPGFLTEATVVASWMKYIPALQRQSGTLKASSNIYKSLGLLLSSFLTLVSLRHIMHIKVLFANE